MRSLRVRSDQDFQGAGGASPNPHLPLLPAPLVFSRQAEAPRFHRGRSAAASARVGVGSTGGSEPLREPRGERSERTRPQGGRGIRAAPVGAAASSTTLTYLRSGDERMLYCIPAAAPNSQKEDGNTARRRRVVLNDELRVERTHLPGTDNEAHRSRQVRTDLLWTDLHRAAATENS